jgi:hypothetical protein
MEENKTPLQKAEELLFAHLDEKQTKDFKEYGMIRVMGSNGELFYLATDDAMHKFYVARVYSRGTEGKRTYCVDFPSLLAPEKILVMKVVVEQCCSLLTGYVDRYERSA